MQAELLVLDDLGAEKTSEWVEETLNLIVNTRYNERRVTIFTSNYPDTPDEEDPNTLLCRVGTRMRSRLHEMCEFLVLDARRLPDGRRRPNAPTTNWCSSGSSSASGRAAACSDAARARARPAARPEERRPQVAGRARRHLAAARPCPPLGLYIHVPFCSAICHYCNFNRGLLDEALKRRYVQAAVGRDSVGAGAAGPRRRAGAWTRSSSAAARRRCSTAARSAPSSTRAGSASPSPPAPRSRSRRTRKRCPPASLAGVPACRA